jgi:hypothetical protein
MRSSWESRLWMTDAKRESWNREGEKADRRMEELFDFCVAADTASEEAEETFGATRADDLFLPILSRVTGRSYVDLAIVLEVGGQQCDVIPLEVLHAKLSEV